MDTNALNELNELNELNDMSSSLEATASDSNDSNDSSDSNDNSGSIDSNGSSAQPCCCGTRHKKRSEEEQKALLTRLRKIEGQIRGLQKMVEEDAYCPDILIQSSAASSALNSFNKVLLGCHIRTCVAEDIRAGNEEKIDELCKLLQKLMK